MKFLFTGLLLLAALTQGYAQTIAGKVSDRDGKPVEAATVTLHRLPDSSLVTADRTNDAGVYSI